MKNELKCRIHFIGRDIITDYQIFVKTRQNLVKAKVEIIQQRLPRSYLIYKIVNVPAVVEPGSSTRPAAFKIAVVVFVGLYFPLMFTLNPLFRSLFDFKGELPARQKMESLLKQGMILNGSNRSEEHTSELQSRLGT